MPHGWEVHAARRRDETPQSDATRLAMSCSSDDSRVVLSVTSAARRASSPSSIARADHTSDARAHVARELAPGAERVRTGLLQQRDQVAVQSRRARAPRARRLRPADAQRLHRQRQHDRDAARLGLLQDGRHHRERLRGIASRDRVEQIAHRFAGADAHDRGDGGLVDRRAAGEARELVELDLQLRELGAHRLLQQRDRAFGDRRREIVLDVVGDPTREFALRSAA